jgi:hypothetical protein
MTKTIQPALFMPAHVVIVTTGDLDLSTEQGVEACVRRMLAVPMDKSLLLDFLHGYQRGGDHASEEHLELHRLQALLNSQFRSKRFNFLGEGLAATLFRQAVRDLPNIMQKASGKKE